MDVLNVFLGKVVDQIINPIILLLVACAFVFFLWVVYGFIAHSTDERYLRGEAKEAIFWGIIGLVIIFGAYGIINIALNTFDLNPIKNVLTGGSNKAP